MEGITITPPHSSPYLRGGWVGLKREDFTVYASLLMTSLVSGLVKSNFYGQSII
jgi:hypothetical protein